MSKCDKYHLRIVDRCRPNIRSQWTINNYQMQRTPQSVWFVISISLLNGMLLSQPCELTMKARIACLEEHVLPFGHDLLVKPPVLADHSWVDINLLVNMNVEKPQQNWLCYQSNITSISTSKENSSPPPQYNQLASSIFSLQHLSNISLHPKITVWRKCLSFMGNYQWSKPWWRKQLGCWKPPQRQSSRTQRIWHGLKSLFDAKTQDHFQKVMWQHWSC